MAEIEQRREDTIKAIQNRHSQVRQPFRAPEAEVEFEALDQRRLPDFNKAKSTPDYVEDYDGELEKPARY